MFPSAAQAGFGWRRESSLGTAGQDEGSQAGDCDGIAISAFCSAKMKSVNQTQRQDIKLCCIRSCVRRQIQMCSLK